MIEKLNTELRSHSQVVPTPIAAPTPDHSAAIIHAVHATANAIRGQASQDAGMLYQGFAHTTGELVRNLQQSHTQGLSQLMNNLSRGFPTVNNLFQSNNRHIHEHRRITVAPDPVHGPSVAAIDEPGEETPKEDKKPKEEHKRPPIKPSVRLTGKRRVEKAEEEISKEAAVQRQHQLQQRRLAIEEQASAPSTATFRMVNPAAARQRSRGRSRDRERTAYQRAETPEYPVNMGAHRPTLPLRAIINAR